MFCVCFSLILLLYFTSLYHCMQLFMDQQLLLTYHYVIYSLINYIFISLYFVHCLSSSCANGCNGRVLKHTVKLERDNCSKFIHIRRLPVDKEEYHKRHHGWPCPHCCGILYAFNGIDDDHCFASALYEPISDIPVSMDTIYGYHLSNWNLAYINKCRSSWHACLFTCLLVQQGRHGSGVSLFVSNNI